MREAGAEPGGSAPLETPLPVHSPRSGAGDAYWRYDLLRFGPLKRLLAHRAFQPLVQLPFVLLFLFLIYVGLFEYPSAGGLPVIFTWVVWWTWIVFAVATVGKVWCTVCPWNAIADWVNRLSLFRRVKEEDQLKRSRPWPRWLRNVSLATTLFVFIIWLELLPGLDLVINPRGTALLALGMLAFSIYAVLRYDRSSFCRYGCFVGRISGLYSMMAPLELRARDLDVCVNCKTKDCYRGNAKGYACPTFEFLGSMNRNTYCILCTECIKTCPEDNVALNLRPFGTDLMRLPSTRSDEAWLSLVMFSLTLFHIITMTPVWSRLERFFRGDLGLHRVLAYSLLMLVILVLPGLAHLATAAASRALARARRVSLRRVFIHFAYPLLPIALFGHLAHNLEHVFEEGGFVIPALTDPLNRGQDLLGLGSDYVVQSMVSAGTLEVIKLALVGMGFLFAVFCAVRVGRGLYGAEERRALVPVLVALVGYAAFQVWLLAEPMVSRLGLV